MANPKTPASKTGITKSLGVGKVGWTGSKAPKGRDPGKPISYGLMTGRDQ